MAHYNVPGVSVAVFEGGKLAWARGFGVKKAGGESPVTAETIFQAASISKPVTATATLRLVDRKELSLDADVNTFLTSWKVPENPFTVKEKVTLRRILTHSACTNIHGFPGYAASAPLPTITQILDGQPPSNTPAIRVLAVPGSNTRYSGGGVTIEQLVLSDHTHKAFPSLMQELVLAPANMTHSTFEQPLSLAKKADAATAHDVAGVPVLGGAHVYPEMAAAGLWSTPSDLLAWAHAISASRAHDGLLTADTATQMLTSDKSPFGLGPMVEGKGRALHFGHQGEDEGFLGEVIYFPETEQGAAVMVNGGGGRPLLREVLYAIAAEYRWPDVAPTELVATVVPAADEDRIVGVYEAMYEVYRIEIRVERRKGRLTITSPRLGIDSDIVFTSPTSFVAKDGGEPFLLVVDGTQDIAALDFGGLQVMRRRTRRSKL